MQSEVNTGTSRARQLVRLTGTESLEALRNFPPTRKNPDLGTWLNLQRWQGLALRQRVGKSEASVGFPGSAEAVLEVKDARSHSEESRTLASSGKLAVLAEGSA